MLLVTNYLDHTVSIIDTNTNKSKATLRVGFNPYGIAVTPDGKYAYVANNGSHSVSVIDVQGKVVVKTIDVGNEKSPLSVAITPDGKYVYVVNNGSSHSVSVISTDLTLSYPITAIVTVGKNPQAIAITPKGDYAYVTNYSDNTVSVITLATNTVKKTIAVAPGPFGVATSSDGHGYVTHMNENMISIVDTSKVASKISNVPNPVGIAMYSTNNYVTNYSQNTLSIIEGKKVEKTISVEQKPSAVTLSLDGSYVYVAHSESKTISKISTSSFETSSIAVGNSPLGLCFGK